MNDFSLSRSSISILEYPELVSSVKNMHASPNELKHSWIRGIGYMSLKVRASSSLYPIQKRREPSFFGEKTIGDAPSDCAGSMTLVRSLLWISVFLNWLYFDPTR